MGGKEDVGIMFRADWENMITAALHALNGHISISKGQNRHESETIWKSAVSFCLHNCLDRSEAKRGQTAPGFFWCGKNSPKMEVIVDA